MPDRAASTPSRVALEGAANESESNLQLSHDELGLEMHHAKAKRLEPSIAESVRTEPSRVIQPVDLDDEATGGGEKVDDVLAQHNLPSERDPELATGQLSPEASLGECGGGAHDASAFVEQAGAS
jgi:hypothetical protein